jgi:MSHA biogenesis protein MshN
MSLINKMLQDLDKRHATDGGGKTLTQQLRPVPATKNWRRLAWEIGVGLLVGGGWAVWVLYQISPRSVVTDLAFQSMAKKPFKTFSGVQAPTDSQAQPPPAAPTVALPAQAPAPQATAVAVVPAPAAPATSVAAPALPAIPVKESARADMLKLATEIGTPFGEKSARARPRAERKLAEPAPAAKTGNRGKPAQQYPAPAAPEPAASAAQAGGTAPAKAPDPTSIDKRLHISTLGERAESEFRKATLLLNQGRVAEAMDGYRLSLQQDAGHAAARQALVGLLLENKRIDEAQQLLQDGLSLNPERSNYAMLLARIQVERGDLPGAHELLSKHAGNAANNADYQAFDAAVLQRLGRHKEAVTGYQAALNLVPGAGVWWMGMGISLQADNRGKEALDAFRRAKSAGGLGPDLVAFVDQRIKQLQ